MYHLRSETLGFYQAQVTRLPFQGLPLRRYNLRNKPHTTFLYQQLIPSLEALPFPSLHPCSCLLWLWQSRYPHLSKPTSASQNRYPHSLQSIHKHPSALQVSKKHLSKTLCQPRLHFLQQKSYSSTCRSHSYAKQGFWSPIHRHSLHSLV